MVQFGRELKREARPEWLAAGLYVEYGSLKQRIKEVLAAKERSEASRLVDSLSAVFQGELDTNISTVLKFYKQHAKGIQSLLKSESHEVAEALLEVDALRSGQSRPSEDEQHWSAQAAAVLEERMRAVQELTSEVTQLLRYISLNMTAIRKILKKYAKHVQLQQPTPGYLTLEIEHPNDPDWHIVQGSFLPAAVAGDLAKMQRHIELLNAVEDLQGLYDELLVCRRGLMARSSMRLPSRGELIFDEAAPLLDRMREAQQGAAQNSALVHPIPWAERLAGMFEPPPPDEFATATVMGLVVNSLSTLLFMMNYTAVIPPIDELCVHLQVSASLAGCIVGASDVAAAFAAIAVSYWTNFSFKQPVIVSASICFLGNILFCLSYEWQSLWLLLLARLCNGLGSARSANRRYTADYVSRANRTMASAAFVGCSNLGQALGPFLSLPLAALPVGLKVFGLTFNSVTAVGWVMATCWLLFILITFLGFTDPPDRLPIGLAAAAPPTSTTTHKHRLRGSPALLVPLLEAPESRSGSLALPAADAAELAQRGVSATASYSSAFGGGQLGGDAPWGGPRGASSSGSDEEEQEEEGGGGEGEALQGAAEGGEADVLLGLREPSFTLPDGTVGMGLEGDPPQGARRGSGGSVSLGGAAWGDTGRGLTPEPAEPHENGGGLDAATSGAGSLLGGRGRKGQWDQGPLVAADKGARDGGQQKPAQQQQQSGMQGAAGGSVLPSWRSTIPATLACTACLFVQKAVQQGFLDGVPLFTGKLYHWRNATAGIFLASVGLGMVPVNLAVGLLSSIISDRALVVISLIGTLGSLAALVWTTTGPAFYFAGGVSLFIGTVVLEGTATSLMSKVIHPRFARGTWNAGLLSTEAGTLGRFAGNSLLSLIGHLTGVDTVPQLTSFATLLHLTLGAGCSALLGYLFWAYGLLAG